MCLCLVVEHKKSLGAQYTSMLVIFNNLRLLLYTDGHHVVATRQLDMASCLLI